MKISDLQLMAEIFRSIFLLNDPNIIEFLLMVINCGMFNLFHLNVPLF